VFGKLRAMFQRRPAKQPTPQRWVFIALECAWEDGQIRHFGTIEDVLGDRTLDEVMRLLVQKQAGAEVALPESYALHVRRPGCEEFEPADGQIPARSLIAERNDLPEGAAVHQLRIQVIPTGDQAVPGRAPQERHSDCLEALASAAPEPEAAQSSAPEPRQADAGAKTPEPSVPSAESLKSPESRKKQRPYLRKTDVLRAQLLPKIEALDFSGLFLGNFGFRAGAQVRSPRLALLSPSEANKYLMLANQHRRAGEYEQAARQYRALIAHDPSNEDFWFLLGKVEEGRGDLKQALHAYENALRLGHASARAEIARIEAEHGASTAVPRDLVGLWRPDYAEPGSQTGGNQ